MRVVFFRVISFLLYKWKNYKNFLKMRAEMVRLLFKGYPYYDCAPTPKQIKWFEKQGFKVRHLTSELYRVSWSKKDYL